MALSTFYWSRFISLFSVTIYTKFMECISVRDPNISLFMAFGARLDNSFLCLLIMTFYTIQILHL